MAGALQNAADPLVKCETVDLEVPASAEIVIEGEVLPHERRVEGPFGEYMGYEAGKSSPKPILKIKAITYRNNPILPFSNMGMPVHEGQTATALIKGAEIYSELKKLGLPVKSVFCPPFGVGHMCVRLDRRFLLSISHAGSPTRYGPRNPACLLITSSSSSPTSIPRIWTKSFTRSPPSAIPSMAYIRCRISRGSRFVAVFAAQGTIDRRCCRRDLRLHLAEGLAGRKHPDQGDLRESLARGSSGSGAQELGKLRLRQTRRKAQPLKILLKKKACCIPSV